MKWEKSCGAVVFKRTEEGIRYVILRSVGGFCGFPKGHVEAGETEHETALREVREEVGLTVRLLDGFRVEESHPIPEKPGVMKQVVYFLADYEEQPLRPQPEEVAEVKLMSYEEAMQVMQFPNTKMVLTKAHEALS